MQLQHMQQQQQRNMYLQNMVQTASPEKLLIMLYDGAIRFCKQGIEAIKTQRFADANTSLQRVQDIVNEFIITIDRSSPLAPSLLQLYDYFNMRLIEANTTKSTEPAEEVLGHLVELKETWVQASRQHLQPAAGTAGTTGTAGQVGGVQSGGKATATAQ